MFPQRFCGFANLSLTTHKDKDVAGLVFPEFVHRIENGLLLAVVSFVPLLDLNRTIANFHRVGSTRNIDNRRVAKVL